MNLGDQFLEKHGFNIETTRKRIFSEDHNWAVPFTGRKDHVAMMSTRTVFKQHGRTTCSID